MKDGKTPNPNTIHPIHGYNKEIYVKPTIKNPNIIVGDFTYIADSDFESHVTHHYEWNGDKLIIGKFCQIAAGVEFVMNGANHQNLIVEGCYVPFEWRKDFEGKYLKHIRFICLAMTGEYINTHYDDIIGHASEIESRITDEDCTSESLQADNQYIIEGFHCAGEEVTLIQDDYEKVINQLLE